MPTVTENFGWYARLMVALAVIAYSDHMSAIPAQVDALRQGAQGVSVVWGPAELKDETGISYSRAYIAKRDSFEEYTVVIRGTNAISWQSWTRQDFDIGTTVPFDTLPGASNAPDGARISRGTYNGMTDLLRLRDPATGSSMVEFLQQATPGTLYVAGHSLGGTLTPPMFAYLKEVLNGGWDAQYMAPFSFAGLTAGDAGFNAYFNGLVDRERPWRFHNTLDIAPFLWWSLSGVQYIYGAHSLGWGTLEGDWLTHKYNEGNGIGYAHPAGGDWPLNGVFRHGFLDQDGSDWTDQAMHQHHGPTYQALVDSAFSGTPAAASGSRGIRQPEAVPAGR